jgi:ubiquinone/menaquinone biosynthesis C-methylase UbiE
MENTWAKYIQSTEELYESRALRFTGANKDLWLDAMKITNGMDVLEIGCAGGIFCHRIKTFLPNATVTGLDRDAGHIAFAKEKSQALGLDCHFTVGDALALPFADNIFDACTSHTVIEHVETATFLQEQYRVLKPGGVVSVLSVRTGLNIALQSRPGQDQAQYEEETALQSKAWAAAGDFDKAHGVGAYEMKEADFPKALENAGFENINVSFISLLPYAPDNADVEDELALQMINVNRTHALSSMQKALNIAPGALTPQKAGRLTALINHRFDTRVNEYLQGEKLWDMATSTVLAATGYKPCD